MPLSAYQNTQLDGILSDWHQYAHAKRDVRGFARSAAGCEDWRASKQWDDQNGALDLDLDLRIVANTGRCIMRMDEPFRSAITENARNLATGWVVWTSPRLPMDRAERDAVVATARENLVRLLKSDGVM